MSNRYGRSRRRMRRFKHQVLSKERRERSRQKGRITRSTKQPRRALNISGPRSKEQRKIEATVETRNIESRSEEKSGGYQLKLSIPRKEMRGSFQGGTRVIGNSTGRKTLGVSNVKGWEDKMDHERIQDTFTYNKNDDPGTPTNEPKLPPPLTIIFLLVEEITNS